MGAVGNWITFGLLMPIGLPGPGWLLGKALRAEAPAVSALDFTKYAWCDGIAPLVSSLYLWTYLSWGEVSRLATAPVVMRVGRGLAARGSCWASRIGGIFSRRIPTLGARTLPLWSPEVAYLFDQGVEPAATARRLLAADIGFVLLTTGSVNEQFLARSRFFRDPDETLVPFWSDADMVLLRIITAAKSTP